MSVARIDPDTEIKVLRTLYIHYFSKILEENEELKKYKHKYKINFIYDKKSSLIDYIKKTKDFIGINVKISTFGSEMRTYASMVRDRLTPTKWKIEFSVDDNNMTCSPYCRINGDELTRKLKKKIDPIMTSIGHSLDIECIKSY